MLRKVLLTGKILNISGTGNDNGFKFYTLLLNIPRNERGKLGADWVNRKFSVNFFLRSRDKLVCEKFTGVSVQIRRFNNEGTITPPPFFNIIFSKHR